MVSVQRRSRSVVTSIEDRGHGEEGGKATDWQTEQYVILLLQVIQYYTADKANDASHPCIFRRKQILAMHLNALYAE